MTFLIEPNTIEGPGGGCSDCPDFGCSGDTNCPELGIPTSQ